jgi:hypothetical protein
VADRTISRSAVGCDCVDGRRPGQAGRQLTRYFHGGLAGFKAGDRILPPAMTGMPSTADYLPAVSHRDRIYATTAVRVARVYAALAPFGGRGDVYEVELNWTTRSNPTAVTASPATQCARRARP